MQNTNVPTNWHFIKLGEACAFSQGVQIDLEKQKAEPFFGGIPFLRIENYTQSSTDIRYIPESLSKNKVICEDDVVVVRYGATAGFVGKGLKGVLANNLFKVEPRADLLTKQFLFIKLKEPKAFRYFQNAMFGGAMPALSFSMVSPFKILLPPLEEQKKIAEILGIWDRAIEELTDLIAEKKELKRGLMQRLLTGTQRLPGFTKPWRKVKLGEVADLYQPVTISAQELSETGFPVYGANGLIGYYEKYNHDTWQIMITCRGSTCGTVNRTYGKSWITGNAMVVNCDNHNVCKLFLYYNLSNRKFNSVISGSGQPQIVRGPLLKYPLCLPADLAEQKAIADVLSKADTEIDLLNQQLDVLREQKRGLMQKLLTGEIRVKVDVE